MLKKYIFKDEIKWFILILTIACIFRITNLNLISFQFDEATTLSHVVKFYSQLYLPEIGMLSSIRINNFPLFDYVIILLSIPSRNPAAITFFIGLINSLLIAFFYLIIRKFINHKTAFFSSLLFATSPWAILFSRKLWAQDVLMFFLIPVIFFTFQVLIKKSAKSSFFLFMFLCLLAQIHAQGIFFTIIEIIIFIILRAKIDLRYALLGILIGLIPVIPYINFQLNTNPLCRDCIAFSAYKQIPRLRDAENFIQPLNILGSSLFKGEFDNPYNNDYSQFLFNYPFSNYLIIIFLLEGGVLLFSVAYIVFKKLKFLFIVFPIIALPVIYYFSRTTPYIIYYVVLLPFIFLSLGIFFDNLTKSNNKIIKYCSTPILFIFIINNIFSIIIFNQFLYLKKVTRGDYGTVFMVTEKRIDSEINQYINYPFYSDLRNYAFSIVYEADFQNNIAKFIQKSDINNRIINNNDN